MRWMWWTVAMGCAPPVLDPGGPVIDLHVHCEPGDCNAQTVADSLGGQLTTGLLSLQHYAIAATLGDADPKDLLGDLSAENERVRTVATGSSSVLLFPSLECLSEVPASDAGWTERCLADADRWIAAGASGFKDHAGKAWDGGELDLALWVGAYNRLAGWCSVPEGDSTPNRTCQAQASARMPLDEPSWRAMVRGLVQDRAVPLVTHAVSWREADTQCGRNGEVQNCFDAGADALVAFADWAQAELTPEARRRIVVAHLGFLQEESRLEQILDAGLSVDLTQSVLASAGCELRQLVADYPTQVVLGTDIRIGQACMPRHYEAWMWGLLGTAGRSRLYRDTCRATMGPVGAALDEPSACGIELAPGAGRRVLHGNAAELLGL